MPDATATRRRIPARDLAGLLAFVAAVAVAALLGGLAAASASSVYAGLDKPAWAPPAALFGPVWTALYAMIAIAGWLVWRRHGVDAAVLAWAAQLVLNAGWTPLFFGVDRYGLAFAEIVLLLVALVVTVVLLARRHRLATWLLLPYLAWVCFAAALNLAIWLRN